MTELRELLVCPACRGCFDWGDDARCTVCGAVYSIRDGLPDLVAAADDHKREQAAFFDEEADDDYEIERPYGTPSFYRWLLEEKLRRSVVGLGPLRGWTALAVCGGSGMEAEFLARRGARVVTADISARAAGRARERAKRHGFEVESIVADVERLPFADASVDLVYVHDGLHHLANPLVGLREMARVARRAVSVNEPARAALTRAAVRAGLALEREEAGNRVARLDPDEVAGELRARGFRVVQSPRYAMLYRHEPGRISRALSDPRVLPLAQVGFRALTRPLAPFGNKLTVQAIRP